LKLEKEISSREEKEKKNSMKFNRTKEEGDDLPRVKLKDKESVYGVLRGEIDEHDVHWVGKASQRCPGAGCALCKTEKSRFRFQVNMVVRGEAEHYTAKILEGGWKLYEQLRILSEEADLEQLLIKILRTGSGQNDTVYTAMPIPKPLTAAQLAMINKVPLIDLKKTVTPIATPSLMNEPTLTEEDIPF
jgi:hypothetical protein